MKHPDNHHVYYCLIRGMLSNLDTTSFTEFENYYHMATKRFRYYQEAFGPDSLSSLMVDEFIYSGKGLLAAFHELSEEKKRYYLDFYKTFLGDTLLQYECYSSPGLPSDSLAPGLLKIDVPFSPDRILIENEGMQYNGPSLVADGSLIVKKGRRSPECPLFIYRNETGKWF